MNTLHIRLSIFCIYSLVGLLSLWHIPDFHSQFHSFHFTDFWPHDQVIHANFSKCPWGFYVQDGWYSPKKTPRVLQIYFNACFFASSYFYKPIAIVKLISFASNCGQNHSFKFLFGSLHGGNPPQIVTVDIGMMSLYFFGSLILCYFLGHPGTQSSTSFGYS